MKKVIYVVTMILIFIVCFGCATISKTKEEKTVVNPDVLLLKSARNGNISEVKRLIKEGVDVNTQDNEGRTALMLTSYFGQTEVTKLLLEQGADIEAQDNEGHTALTLATEQGHTDITKLLGEVGMK